MFYGGLMSRKILLMLALTFCHLLSADLMQENSSNIQFKREKVRFGLERQEMILINDEGKPEQVGFIVITSCGQFSALDPSIFAGVDKSTLVPEVLELIDLVSSVKSELTTSLGQVVLLGDLYVDPKYRGQGYAKLLIQNTCQEIFSNAQTNFIVLTPDPFEYENNIQKTLGGTSEYEAKKDLLIKLYGSLGFVGCQRDLFFMYLKRRKGL